MVINNISKVNLHTTATTQIAGRTSEIMTTKKVYWEEIGVKADISMFMPKGKTHEIHAIIHVTPRDDDFQSQYQRLEKGYLNLLSVCDDSGLKPITKRFFLSDATNQRPLLQQTHDCAVSFIQQAPLDGSKIALWVYLADNMEKKIHDDGLLEASHNGYRHLWSMGMQDSNGDSYQQTMSLLCKYEKSLAGKNASITDNCIRTWFFVRDVDTQYSGMVKARKENFIQHGLTQQTHYIASTGICGIPSDPKAIIQLDAYAMTGFHKQQQKYLYAPTHLNPTYEYGVTFERGTAIQFGDRSHVYISGTASINNKGEVINIGNVEKQAERMWENVGKLLEEANAGFDNVAYIIVYLRDVADYSKINGMFSKRFPNIPYIVTLAPVCRPTWLIEMECMAIVDNNNPQWNDF